ncbi:MAG TPA: LPXTG cell wall anchor domain-containing protein [Candidatus Faecousia excrementipullorum]|nr:LPXTG cell wall anchor domain-containing protein [Candidatus Faecousia excrementipullorum]
MVLGQAVLAEPQEALTGEIILPVTIRAEGTLPDTPDVYTLVLEGEEGVPMPEGSEDQRYQFQVTGAQTTAFPTIVCNTVGIYRYTISQEPGENAYCTYDEIKYQVLVTITYQEQGEGLDVAIAIAPEGSTDKTDAALFVNSYERPPVEIPQTGEVENLSLILGLWVCSLLAVALLWKQRKTV